MESILYNLCLTLHIVGFTLFAGITFADFMAFRRFWKVWDEDPARALLTREITSAFPPVMRFSGIALVLAGVSMLLLVRGVFSEQLWFRIKMVLVFCLIVNGIFAGRLQRLQLKKLLEGKPGTPALLRARIRLFHVLQLALIGGIFLLTAFRFN